MVAWPCLPQTAAAQSKLLTSSLPSLPHASGSPLIPPSPLYLSIYNPAAVAQSKSLKNGEKLATLLKDQGLTVELAK